MPKTVDEFTGFGVGDIVTLSDFQTQTEFGQPEVDFKITAARSYRCPDDRFLLTCYILEGPNDDEQPFMLMVKEVGDAYDLFVYFLEQQGELYKAEDGQPECELLNLFKEEEDDLKERIEAAIVDKDGNEQSVTWDKQNGSTFGVQYSDTDEDNGITTVAEYFTDDGEVNYGNDRCFIDWKGSQESGSIEAWYGCLVEDHEVQVYSLNEDEDPDGDDWDD